MFNNTNTSKRKSIKNKTGETINDMMFENKLKNDPSLRAGLKQDYDLKDDKIGDLFSVLNADDDYENEFSNRLFDNEIKEEELKKPPPKLFSSVKYNDVNDDLVKLAYNSYIRDLALPF